MGRDTLPRIHFVEVREKDHLRGYWKKWRLLFWRLSYRSAKREAEILRQTEFNDVRDGQVRVVTFKRGRVYGVSA